MPVITGIIALALTATQAGSQEGLFDAGVERDRHILVSTGGVPERPTGSFAASGFAIPVNWPADSSTYEGWIAEFDCVARTRRMKFRIVYSGRRDPIRTELADAPIERGGRAVEAQLNILCNRSERAAMRLYNNVGEFTRSLGQAD